jgi:hypothetical protein
MQSKQKDLMKPNKWKNWRIINSIAIFFSFFAPWAGGERDLSHALITGFKTLDFYGRLGIDFLTNVNLSSHTGINLLTKYFLGLVAILIYCVLNMLLAVFRAKLVDKLIWRLLTFFLIALGAISLWHVSALDAGWYALSNSLWGYWLVLIGLVSSIALEISYFLSNRT